MKKTLVFSALSLGVAFSALSQTYPQLGIYVPIAAPDGDFAKNTRSVGAGIGLNFHVPVSEDVPIFFGLDFNYVNIGAYAQDKVLTADLKVGETVIDRLTMPLRIETNNNIVGLHLCTRIKAPLEKVQPYVEALAGFRYFYTRTKILDNSPERYFTRNQDNNVIRARTNMSSFVLSYGGGAGVQFMFSEKFGLDVGVVYLLSSREAEYYTKEDTQNWKVEFQGDVANYVKGESFKDEDNQVSIEALPKKSRVDMFYASIGMVITF